MKTQELNALADRLEHHTGWLATQKLNMTLSDWCSVSNDFLDAAKVLRTAATSQASEASVETATPAQEVVGYVCTGCGHLAKDPVDDMKSIRESGAVSCCPERNMKAVYLHAAPAPSGTEALRTVARDTWLALEGYLNDECSFGCCGSFSETERSNCINIIVNSLARGHAKQSEIITALSTPAPAQQEINRRKA